MRRVFAVLLLLVACAKPPPPKKIIEEKPPDPKDEARAVLKAAYSAFEAAEPERLVDVFTADAMVFGLGPSETFNFRDPLIDRLKQELMPLGLRGDSMKVTESAIHVGMADGGRSAWLYDVPKVIFEHKGEPTIWLPRVTAHAIHDGTGWRLDALHVSLAVSEAAMNAPDALRKFLSPAEVGSERGPDSDQIIGVAKRMQEDPGVKLDRISERDEVYLLGTSPGELYTGKMLRDLKPRLAELRKTYLAPKIDGALRARLAPDGKTGWVAGVVVLRTATGKKQQSLPPLRALWIFIEDKGFWNIVSEHMSVPLKVDQRQPATDEELKARKDTPLEPPKKPRKYDDDGGTTYW